MSNQRINADNYWTWPFLDQQLPSLLLVCRFSLTLVGFTFASRKNANINPPFCPASNPFTTPLHSSYNILIGAQQSLCVVFIHSGFRSGRSSVKLLSVTNLLFGKVNAWLWRVHCIVKHTLYSCLEICFPDKPYVWDIMEDIGL